MRFEVLGPFRIIDQNGSVLSLTSGRQRAVLALLLLADGHPISAERLIEAVWGDDLPANPANTLQQTMTQLRKVLEPVRDSSAKPTVIVSSDAGYHLDLAGHELDTTRFEQLLSHAGELRSKNRLSEALDAAETAAALWRGPLAYADVQDVVAIAAEQRRWAERRIETHELAIECRLAIDGPETVIPQLEVLTTEHPHREVLWSQLMTALYRAGRQADAIRAFQRASDTAAELGLVVSPRLRDLEQQILLQDEVLAEPEVQVAASNLPVARKRVIGRETELSEVAKLLGQSRLVTLTGPGGSGKTELALELARRQRDEPHGGIDAVWLIKLEDLRDPALLESSVAAAVGMPESGERSVRASLIEHFDDSNILLVLDNCEHLVEEVSDLVTDLLASGQNLTVLATSQIALDVAGEHRFSLTPLAVPSDQDDVFARLDDAPAVQLFIERAKEVDASFAVVESDVGAIVNIVTFLDGMPLAIELAAARTRSLTPVEIARLLLDGPDLLSNTRRDAPERQRSLASTIEWSYGLLSEDEQRAFTLLSVFAGAFDAEAAAVVMQTTEVVAQDMIDQLIASSIVSREKPVADRSRFRLLDTLRHFAAEKGAADPAEANAAGRRHAEFFATRAAKLDLDLIGQDQKQAFVRLVADEDNYRSAMAWCLDRDPSILDDLQPGVAIAAHLGRFWDWRGDLAEASTWLSRFEAAANEATPASPDLWLLLSWDAFFASELGQPQRATRSGSIAKALAATSGDYARLVVRSGQGLAMRLDGRPKDALIYAEQVAEQASELGQDWWVAISNNLRALAHLDLDDLDAASDAAADAHQQFTAIGDRRAIGWVLTAQAQIELERGNLDAATNQADKASTTSIEAGDGRNAAWAFQIGAAAATAAGNEDRASELRAQAQTAVIGRGMAIAPWASS